MTHFGDTGDGSSDLSAGPPQPVDERRASPPSELYRRVIERSTQPFALGYFDGRLGRPNQALCDLLGYSAAEFARLNWSADLTPAEWHAEEAAQLDRLLAGASSVRYEKEYLHRDGHRVPVELLVHLERGPAGEPLHYFGFITDLSERKQRESELHASRQRYQELSEIGGEAIFLIDNAEGRILEANSAASEMYGYTRAELLSMRNTDLSAEAAETSRYVSAAPLGPARVPRRLHRHRNGEVIPVEIFGRFFELGGRPVHVAAIRDISDRVAAERALVERERQLSTLLSNLPGMAYRCRADDNWTMVFVSDGCLDLTGYSAAEITHSAAISYAEIIVPEDRAEVTAQVSLAVEQSRSFVLEYRIRRKDGELRWVWEKGVAVPSEGGAPLLEGFVVDVTERVQAERALRQTEERLRLAQKMEAIGRLAGGVAHDFNNLLTVIIGRAECALDALPADSEAAQDLQEILAAGERAGSLTRQLLAFGRRQVLEPRLLRLDAVVDALRGMLQRLMGEDITLSTSAAPNLGLVRADRGQLEQVLMNLAVNARDAMPRGGRLSVEIDAVECVDPSGDADHVPVEGPGTHLRMRVRDTGTGMDEATCARIFEPFFTTKEKGRGTGLGLATVHGIVAQSGGRIRVQSEPGAGTTFEILLPRVDGEEDRSTTLPGLPRSRGGETILVVEDSESVRVLATRVLAAAGYTVTSATGGAEALELCTQTRPPVALVLTDVVMPGMSGTSLAALLPAASPGTRVLFMSGYPDETLGSHGVLESGTHFIGKPFTGAALLTKVREVLDS